MENKDNIYKKLDQFIRKYYLNQLIKGSILSLLSILLLFITISVFEFYLKFDVIFRTTLFWLYIIINSLMILNYIVVPILKLFKFRNGIKYSDAAKILGKHFNEIDDKLVNILELAEMDKSNDLINASIEQKTATISPVPFLNAIDLKRNIKHGYWLLIPFVLLFVLFISGKQKVITDSSERIIKHNTFFEPEAPYSIIFEENLVAEQYDDFLIKFRVEGEEIPKNFYIEYQNNRFMVQNKSNNSHQFLFKNIQKEENFRLNGGGYKSKNYSIEVIPKPIIKNVTTKIIPPKYTKLKAEKLNSIENITVVEGSQVDWKIDLNNIDSVLFKLNSKKIIEKVDNSFSFDNKIFSDQNAEFSYSNKYGLGDTINFKITVLKDQFPSISVSQAFDSINNIVFLDGTISDDYGINALIFNYIISSGEDKSIKTIKVPISNDINQNFFYEFQLNNLNLNDGDEINYFLEVFDNDKINGSKKTKSADFIYKKKSKKELIAEKDIINAKLKSSLNNSSIKADELKKEIEELNKILLDKKKVGWQEKEKAKEILKKQKEILNEIEENKKLNSIQQKKQSDLNSTTLEKQKKLKELMDNVVDDELKELLEEFEELLNEDDKEKLKELLDKLDLKNEDLEKELDRELELFKQLEFEQKTEEIIEDINKLKNEQENLKKETDLNKKDSDELSKEQKKLEDSMQEIEKSIDELEDKNNKLENKNTMPETEDIEKDINKLMKESAEDLNKKKKKSSSKKQKESVEKLEELENMMSAMQQSNSEEMQIENMETLREILDNLIILSFTQEELIEKTNDIKITSSEFVSLVRKQKQLVLDSKIIEDSLFALSKRAVKIQSKINTEITQIKDNMKQSQNYLEERKIKKSSEKQQFVMTSANNLALLLSEILKNMQMDLSMMPSSCKKPKNCNNPKNSNSMSMSDIKKAQKKLNEKMKNGGKNGKKNKGKNKMSSKELMQLARKQGLIKSELENMQNKNKGSKGSKIIDEIKKQMEENEYDIINNNISNTTFERLDELIENFIDYDKAKKEEGEEEKRESDEWLIDQKGSNDFFDEIVKKKRKQLELINSNPINFKPYYKKEVSKYFNSIYKE